MHYTAPADRLVAEEETHASVPVGESFAAPDPVPLQRLRQIMAMPAETGAVLFLGERRTPGGRRRLVIVRRQPAKFDPWFELPTGYNVTLVDLDALPNVGPLHPFVYELVPSELDPAQPKSTPLRFFAGQRDPDNQSHFAISSEMNGRRYTIDGWLRDPPAPFDPLVLRINRVRVPWTEPWVDLHLHHGPTGSLP
jgi:hypothetical protein